MSELIFNFGAMNSGKSAKLLQMAHQLERSGIEFKVATAEQHTSTISSRLGISRACMHIDGVLTQYRESVFLPKFILIDEAQFLKSHHVMKLRKIVDRAKDTTIICYGLRTDIDGALFDGAKALFVLADKVVQSDSFCEHCDKPAVLHNFLPNVKLKGKDKYESVCFNHFKGKY